MNKKRLTSLAAVAACALGAAPAVADATTVEQASSENWSGYVVNDSSLGKSFRSVSGSWVQPTAKCSTGQGYAAFWVGLGGSGQSESLEQAGTEAECSSGGQASYFAWYELVPKAPVKLDLEVTPGDHMTSRVQVSGDQVTLYVADQTSGQSVTRTLGMSNPDTSSAEWIAEAPSRCDQSVSQCEPMPLADFGSVSFTSAGATASDGQSGSISDPEWQADAVSLDSSDSQAGATPSSLTGDGGQFSVTWSDDSSSSSGVSTSQSEGYGQGSGYGGDPYGETGSGYGYGYGGYSGYGYPGASGYGSGAWAGYAGGYGD